MVFFFQVIRIIRLAFPVAINGLIDSTEREAQVADKKKQERTKDEARF